MSRAESLTQGEVTGITGKGLVSQRLSDAPGPSALSLHWMLLALQLHSPAGWVRPRWLSDKEPACQCKRQGSITRREDPLKKGMATHSNILAWRIPWTEEPGGLPSMGVAKNWTRLSDYHFTSLYFFSLRKLTWSDHFHKNLLGTFFHMG